MEFISGAGQFIGALASLAAFVLAACFLYAYFRTGSLHILFLWMWRRVSGKREPKDADVIELLDERYDRDTFRFFSGVRAESLSQAKKVKAWANANNIPLSKIARCGRYFDLTALRIREDKLPSCPRRISAWAGVIVPFLAGVVILFWSAVIQTVYFSFTADGNWFGMTKESAVRWEEPNAPLTLAMCQSRPLSAAQVAATGFKPSQVEDICHYLTASDVGQQWKRDLNEQQMAGIILFLLCVVIAFPALLYLVQQGHAREILEDQRNRGAGDPPVR